MKPTPLTPEALDAIADEHEVLADLYERILSALEGGADQLSCAALLDELVEKLAEHFAHEERGGYYSHVLEIAPWRAAAVKELERQHADLYKSVARVAQGARSADGSAQSWAVIRKDFNEFLRRCVEHESKEKRLIQETFLLDVAAAD